MQHQTESDDDFVLISSCGSNLFHFGATNRQEWDLSFHFPEIGSLLHLCCLTQWLHSTGTSRQLVRSVAGRGREEGMQDDFGRSEGGKLIIRVRITSPDLTPAQAFHVEIPPLIRFQSTFIN